MSDNNSGMFSANCIRFLQDLMSDNGMVAFNFEDFS
jgi:hypothetical protein